MSLSLDRGERKIAKVLSGKQKGKDIYLNTGETGNVGMLSKKFFEKYKKLKKSKAKKLKRALEWGERPEEPDLQEIYDSAAEDIKKISTDKFKLDGKLSPVPQDGIIEKIYVSAPSGAGKSTWCSNYIKKYKKMFPENEVYVFSTVEEDEALDKHDPIRVDLHELVEGVNPYDYEYSLCVFDDVDSITETPIRNSVIALRGWLLEQGRHIKARMLCTSHILMNYKSTRRLLNEATAVVMFPKAGSTYQIKKFLEKYVGMDSKDITKLLRLDSRWVAVYKTYPTFIMYEKGVYLLKQEE